MDGGFSNASPAMPALPPSSGVGLVPYVGGMVRMMSNAQLDAQQRADAQQANNQPVIQGLVGHVRQCWTIAKDAKMMTVEPRMLKSMRQRRGEYDPEVLAEIRKGGGSEIYMMLSSNKARAAASWLRDVLLSAGKDKPWTIDPTPLPDLPPSMAQTVAKMAYQEAVKFQQETGQQVGETEMEQVVSMIKDRIVAQAKKRAKDAAARMELKMEDQLAEGGFIKALGQFIEDVVTFPSAIMKGPVVRKKRKLAWDMTNMAEPKLDIQEKLVLEWERVDPLMAYPSPNATEIEDGFFIQRHQMSRGDLTELIGVDGYNDDAIRAVLDEYGRNGLKDWLYVDSAKAEVEGKSMSSIYQNVEGTMDALQFWGSVQGKLLVEWGMDEKSVPDKLKEYQCEVWVIGQWCIKAMLNPDPLGRRPYYKASYEEVPGTFWGNSPMDLCRDSQTQCNTAARAIANNMNIASGPQVAVNVDRLPAGEDVTQIYPWKVWQTTSDPYGSTAKAVDFFMPSAIAGELMNIYTFFSNLADEHTGVPRYMTGDANVGGAGRTASGMSMLIGNAGKAIKQVVANVDMYILSQAIDRLYFYNMYYGEDPHLKGDVNVVARGATGLMLKEQAQVRINEFMSIVLSNDTLKEIVGPEAIAELLRQGAKQLDLDTDGIVPPVEIIRARIYQQQMAARQQQALAVQMETQPRNSMTFKKSPEGGTEVEQTVEWQHAPLGMPTPVPGVGGAPSPKKIMPGQGQTLNDGTPVTDNFAPSRV